MKFYTFKVWDRVELRDRSIAGTVVRTITSQLGAQICEIRWDEPDGKRVMHLSYDLVPALELPVRALA